MILGLDISTSTIGYALLDDNGVFRKMDHIDLMKPKDMTFWQKVDAARQALDALCRDQKIKHVFIEEVKKNFKAGESSATVIVKMARFNGICSSMVRQMTGGKDPTYIVEGHARKVCGLKMTSKKKAEGKSHKEQAFDQMSVRSLFKNRTWDLKRTGRIKDYHYDEMDAYIIVRSGYLEFVAN